MRTIIILFVVITILTLVVIGGVVYYSQLNNINNLTTQHQADLDKLNQQIHDLQKQLADNQQFDNSQPAVRIFAEGQPYEFQLTIPSDWKDVIVAEEHPSAKDDQREVGYRFSLTAPSTQKEAFMFVINVYKNDIWKNVEGTLPNNEVIYKNTEYTYTMGQRLDWGGEGFSDTLTPASSIIKTFKANVVSIADPYEGWLTYTNSKYGYTIAYPKGAQIKEISKDEISKSDIVGVAINYKYGHVTVILKEAFPGWGIGCDITPLKEKVTIEGKLYNSSGYDVRCPGTDNLQNHSQVLKTEINSNLMIEYGSYALENPTALFNSYLEQKPEIIKIVESFNRTLGQ
ncbi:MAG: hypothetical protein NTZ49_03195 [Candidatus Parcubacteria bacterium]|nr:hypothetical protein [Candidatus Parcubacteria bacterium]